MSLVPGVKQPLLPQFSDQKARDWAYYRSPQEIREEPALLGYAHHVLRAFDKEVLGITGALCVDGRPTIYFRRDNQPTSWGDANRLHRIFWNQGIATVLVLADPEHLRIYSAQAEPVPKDDASSQPAALVEDQLEDIADLLELESLLHDVASGRFYHTNAGRFNEKQAVDEFLLRNLADARDHLRTGPHKLKEEAAHALLGRLIFLCYLTDRKVIDWADYEKEVGRGVANVRQLLKKYDAEEGLQRLYRLLARLQAVFNGSMFDQNLETESRRLRASHYDVLRQFFSVGEVRTGQGMLPFWAYDFSVIPVESISAIYEDFLSAEDAEGKRKEGAYYTPRHLAEMVVDIAVGDDPDWTKHRYLDPACGSGIFLVTLFNRLASHWVFQNGHASYAKRAQALLSILYDQIRGVDIERTACRIASFSLYLAFLDQFDPRDIRDFARLAQRDKRKVLPKLLHYRDSPWREKHPPTIVHADFLQLDSGTDKFDCVIGNPPWAGRGTQQLAWKFMQQAPEHLEKGACGCLLLPAKVLFNKTDELQKKWFQTVTVERVINLADFSFVLFEHAKCPALIVRFANAKPADSRRIQYDTPKVTGTDCRDGVVTIFPRDRKRLQQSALLVAADKEQAPSFWKRHFSGTPRDWRLLDLLDEMPKLKEQVANPRRCKGRKVPFFGGEGIQPHGGDSNDAWWTDETAFLDADNAAIALHIFEKDCAKAKEHLPRVVHRERDERLFKPPLVVISRGFGKVAFVDFPVVFQHALYSIAPSDEHSADREMKGNILRFLAVFLRSKLAWYYIFHTASSLALERDQVHRVEMLELPFPLPGHEYANPNAHDLVRKIAASFDASRRQVLGSLDELHRERERLGLEVTSKEFTSMLKGFTATRLEQVRSVQNALETLVFRYFDLTDEEIDLVEDTASVYHPSATPTSREIVRQGEMPTLQPVANSALREYANVLIGILNGWAKGSGLRVSASAARFDDRPFVLFSLRQTRTPVRFRLENATSRTSALLERIYDAARQTQGRFEYPRAVTFFDGTSIHLLKPVPLMHWTRTSALNDADEIFADIIRQRRAKPA
jgi:hypothetical protein